jgi:serine/threonine protein kinase
VADVLGRGGQAVTYLAFDPDLRRKVVIKEYHARGGEIEHEAVLNEGRSLARINSRYVAKCLTVERLGDHIYLVMEHIPGKNLWDAAHEQSFEFTQAAQLVAQIAEGLSDVHRCGILHRDIKPANIIVHADGTARLVDFGLAATLSSSALESIGGTLQFMAPEQAVGDSDQIDWRADLFGLGAVLYWLVTGRPPYEGNNRDDIWRKAQRGEFLKPRDVNPQVPPELERICLKAMATRPSGRYGTADRFARALRRYLRGRASGLPSSETVAVSPPDQFVSNPAVDTRSSTASGIETAPEYARRRVPRWIAPIVVALGIMLAMILTTVLWKSNPDGSQSGILVSGTGPIQVEKFDIQVSPQGRAFVAVDRAVPLRLGDSVHFSVRLSRPAHVRLLWIDARGKAEELYPNDPEFGRRETEPVMEFESPLQLDRGWPLRDLVGGREIALLLVNAGPLPDIALRPSLLASPADNERQVARFTATRTEAPARLGLVATSMRALGHDSQRIDDPTYQLLEELRKQCDMVRAISIPVSTSHD